MAGIIGYGTYIPKYRIKLSEIADVWEKDTGEITGGLKVTEKSVPAMDEDAVTMAVEAAKKAIAMADLDPAAIQSIYLGSESRPYAVNVSASIVAAYLGMSNDYFAADMEFACKGGTSGLQVTAGLIGSNHSTYGLVIGSDTAQGKPRDALEYTAASAACAYLLGNNDSEIIANILAMSSFATDTPDFWRRDGMKFPSHMGRFTAYFTHIIAEGKKLLHNSGLQPKDFAYCIFHMPNGKYPRVVAEKLGFTQEQLAPSLTVDAIGNPYTAASLLGLAAVLDIAKPHEKIFFVSYGSGAGSDGFIFETTETIIKKQKKLLPVSKQLENKQYISYTQYLKQMRMI